MRDDAGPAVDAARALLPGVELAALERLGSGERSQVWRLRAQWPGEAPRRLVVKHYRAAGRGWQREVAALRLLPGELLGPRLVAHGADPPVAVTADLGDGPTLAQLLLGTDARAAADAVVAWAEALAALHVASRGLREPFRVALSEIGADPPLAESPLGPALADAVRVLDRECASLGVRVPDGALDDLRGLAARLGGPDGPAAITPGDTCPDDSVRTAAGWVLTDYEDAQWRHLAWDVAYLRVPFPTCWCSWALPAEVADAAVAGYRRVAAQAFPEVSGPGFERDVAAATAGWAMLATSWSLDGALSTAAVLADPARPAPRRRGLVLHRLDRAARAGDPPAVAELAGRLAAALRERWDDPPLPYARAFRRAP